MFASFALAVAVSVLVPDTHAQSAPFSPTDVATMRGFFERNIGVSQSDCLCGVTCHPGFVVAAPTQDNPDYYYHWQRDAGISMHVLQYTSNNSAAAIADWDQKFQNYVQWVVTVQTETDPNSGQNILGEPKFNCDASVYSGGWCRPQNDGPAARSIALINYAFYLLNNSREAYVNQYLFKYQSDQFYQDDFDFNYHADTAYHRRARNDEEAKVNCSAVNIPNDAKVDCGYNGINSTLCVNRGCCWYEIHENPNNDPWCFYPNTTRPTPAPVPTPAPTPYAGAGTIVTDLNYVASVWQSTNTCDLWEEISGVMQFYTLMVQRFALLYGAALASKLGDSSTASSWTSTANQMTADIQAFDIGGIISEKSRKWDCSVILGSLYGGTPNQFLPSAATMFPPTNTDVLTTVNATIAYFKTAFPLNQELDGEGVPGTLLGRYANDKYDGCDANGGSQGHAWILCSNALAELWYRNSAYYYQHKADGKTILNERRLRIIADLMEKDLPSGTSYLMKYVESGRLAGVDEVEMEQIMLSIAGLFASQGDGQLTRVAMFVSDPCEDHMSEQICEATTANGGGLEIGAHDLTWSYGTVLSAMYYRDEALKMGVTPWDETINQRRGKFAFGRVGEDCSQNVCSGQCKD